MTFFFFFKSTVLHGYFIAGCSIAGCVCVPKHIDRVSVCGNTVIVFFYWTSLFSGQYSLLRLIFHKNIINNQSLLEKDF